MFSKQSLSNIMIKIKLIAKLVSILAIGSTVVFTTYNLEAREYDFGLLYSDFSVQVQKLSPKNLKSAFQAIRDSAPSGNIEDPFTTHFVRKLNWYLRNIRTLFGQKMENISGTIEDQTVKEAFDERTNTYMDDILPDRDLTKEEALGYMKDLKENQKKFDKFISEQQSE